LSLPDRTSSASLISASSGTGTGTKTHEELVHENATLKETLDRLSKQLEWLNKERQRDRDAMMGSVTLFARDVRKQAERVIGQSVTNLAESRRNLPRPGQQHPPASAGSAHAYQSAPTTGMPHSPEDGAAAQKRIQELQEEVKAARQEAEKQTMRAQQYKTKYDDLRTAILEKRKAKAASAAASAVPPGQTPPVVTAGTEGTGSEGRSRQASNSGKDGDG